MSFEPHTKNIEQAFARQEIALIRHRFLRATQLANRAIPVDNIRVEFYIPKTSPTEGEDLGMNCIIIKDGEVQDMGQPSAR